MNRKHLLNKGLLKFGQLIKSFFNSTIVKDRIFAFLPQIQLKAFSINFTALLMLGILFTGHTNLFAQHPAPSFNAASYSFCEGENLVFTLNGLPDPSGFPGGDVAVNITWYMSTSSSCGSNEITDVESVIINSTSHTFNTGHILSYPAENNGLLMITTSLFDPLDAEGGQEIIMAQTTCIPITVNPLPVGSISPTSAVAAICEGNTYQVDFTATVGTGPYDLIINGFPFNGIASGGTIDLVEGVHFTGSMANIDLTSITDTGVMPNCTTTGAPITNLISPTLNAFMMRGVLTADETICPASTPANITGSASTGTGGSTVSYGWESSSDNGSNWVLIAGEVTNNYAPGPLTQDMWYRRIDTLNTGGFLCWTPIDTVIITVNNITISNTLSADEVVCDGQTPTAITGTASTMDGTPTYGWELSTDNGAVWNPIVGETGIGYAPPGAILMDTWYRRVDTSNVGGFKCFEYIDTVRVFLNNFTAIGNFSTGDETICPGGNPNPILQGSSSTGGDVAVTFGWELTTDGGTNWLSIAAATNDNYDPPNPIFIDTWYRRIDTISRMGVKCVAIVDTTVVLVNNITTKGTLSGDEAICAGVTPSPITGTASLGDGAISYGWEENINGGGWNVLATETGTGLTLGAITVDTWYRRIDTTNLGGFKCTEIVDTVRILVNNFTAIGMLNNPDDTICVGDTPMPITGTASTSTGTISYGWESNVNGMGWNLIVGATNTGFSPTAITEDTWYRRIDTSEVSGFKCIEIVDTVKVIVNNITTKGTLSADQVICPNTAPLGITGSTSSGDGTISYGWESTTDIGSGSWTLEAGVVGTGIAPGVIAVDTWYRRIDTTNLVGEKCWEAVDTVAIMVNDIVISTVLSADQIICKGATPSMISGMASVSDGGQTYGWQFTADAGGTWTTIAGETGMGYTPIAGITTDTWYRRVDTSNVGGVKCFEFIDTVRVVINDFTFLSTLDNADETICSGVVPMAITGTPSTGGDVTVTYGWELTTDDGTNWAIIAGETGTNYTPTVGIMTDTWYRRIDTTSLSGVKCTAIIDTVKVTVNNFLTTGNITNSDDTICSGITPPNLTGNPSTGDGTISYGWDLTTDNGTNWIAISGANGVSYAPPLPITTDTWYRRVDTNSIGSVQCVEIVDTVKVIVNNFQVVGSLTNPDDTICSGIMPTAINGPGSTADGTVTYGWEHTTDNGTSWVSIAGAVTANYSPLAITTDTWYRRIDTTTLGSTQCTIIVDTVKVVVNNLTTLGILSADETICEGITPSMITGSASTVDGVLTYGWAVSTDGTTFSTIVGETNINYSPPALVQDTWYARTDTTTLGGSQCFAIIDTVKITVNNITISTVLSADEVICSGVTPSAITGSTSTADGTLTYGWELSADDGTSWTQIPSATAAGYVPPSGISTDTWYRRIDTSNVGGIKCFVALDTVKVIVNDFTTQGNLVTPDETICTGVTPSSILGLSSFRGGTEATYGWELSTDNGTSWSSITGETTSNYTATAGINMDTWYRRIDTTTLSGIQCTVFADTVRVTVNNFLALGNLVTGNDTICTGSVPPNLIGNPTTADGTVAYGWDLSTDDGTSWTTISGANSVNYLPALPITTDTWYRRVDTSTLSGVQCLEIIDTVKIIVNNFQVLGSLTNTDETICSGVIPTAISGPGSTADGTVTYGWEQTTDDGISWASIAGAVTTNYSPPAITSDTWYRRIDTTTLGSTQCMAIVDTVKVIVNNLTTLGVLSADETICQGTAPSTITGSASTVDGVLTYGWATSTDGTTFSTIVGETNVNYAPPALMQDTWYIRIDTTTLGASQCHQTVDTVKITVNNIVISTVLSADQIICKGATPNMISGTASVSDGGQTYGWQSTADAGVTWTTIAGETGMSYTPTMGITTDTWYRRVDTSNVGGIKCFEFIDTVRVIINDFSFLSTLDNADETICSGVVPTAITGTPSTGGDMAVTYGWESTTDNGTTWVIIAGETGTNYTPTLGITADTWYRRIDTTSLSGVKCTAIIDTVRVSVNNFLTIGNIINSDDTICIGTTPPNLIGNPSTADGTISYGWDLSTDDGTSWTTISGANSVNYLPALPITTDTWYRRVDTSTLGSIQCLEIIDTVKIIVNNFITLGTLTNADETICSGVVPTTISGSGSTADGTVTYGWEQTIDDGTSWTSIVGAATTNYSPLAITSDTWYRRIDTTTLGNTQCIAIVDTVKVIVNNLTALGTLSADETICQGTAPSMITGTASTVDGVLTYGWAVSTDGTTFTTIVGETNVNYAPPALMQDTWYIRTDTTTIGASQCHQTVDTVKITVNNIVISTVLSADQTICTGETPSMISGTASVSDGGQTYGWQSTIDAGTTWIDLVGETGMGYTPTMGITTDTWYRRIDTSNVGGIKCFEFIDTVKVIINDFTTQGTLNNADETICSDVVPTAITGTPSTGGDVAVTYGWESTTDNGTTWTSIAGQTGMDYTPTLGITVDTWYRRIDTTSLSGVKCTVFADTVKVTVNNFLTLGNIINSDDTICAGTTPPNLIGNPTTADGTVSYGWDVSTDDGMTWTPIVGATFVNYLPTGGITTDTWYRRADTSTLNMTQCIAIVDTVKIIVNNFTTTGTLANADETICSGATPTAITGSVSVGDGTISYGWEQTTDGTTWTSLAGEITTGYTPMALTVDTWYRRIDTTTLGSTQCIAIVDTVKVIVNNLTALGTLSADETICQGTAPSMITGTASTVDGVLNYGWAVSTDGTTFTTIVGATNINYAPPALMQDTWYIRTDTTTLGASQCHQTVDTVKITVNNIVISTVLSADQTICTGDTPSMISGMASVSDGGQTYGWQSTIDAGTTWTDLVGETGMGYTSTMGITTDTWYRRIDTSNVGGIKCFEFIDTVKVIINDFTAQGSLNNADEVICSGIVPTAITGIPSTGGDVAVTYGWESTTDNGTTWTSIAGQTGMDYTPTLGITADTWYRRIDTTSLSGVKCTVFADTVKVTVNNFLTLGNIINSDDTICAGTTPPNLIGNPTTADGVISFGWDLSTDNGTSWTPIAGATFVNHLPTTGITTDTWYRRVDTTTIGTNQCLRIIDTVKIIVNNFTTIGTLTSPNDTICSGVIPNPINGTASVVDGTVSYGWEQTTNGTTWTAIAGEAMMSYTPSVALMVDTWYRRIDTATLGTNQCIEIVDTVKIIVNNLTTLGTLSPDETICQGATPTNIMGTASTVDGTLTYGWASSTNALIFTPIAGETGMNYAPPAITEDTWYIRIDTTTLGTTQCYQTVDTVKVTVNNIAISTVLSADQTICQDEIPANITGMITATDGTSSHGWEYSNDNGASWNLIAGATNLGYNPTASIAIDTWYRRVDTSDLGGIKCFAAVDTVVVTVSPKPVPVIAGTITEICIGNAIYLPFTVAGGSGVYTDTTWLTSDVTRATVDADGLITGIASGISNIRAVVTDANGCKDTSNTHTVFILTLPTAGAITGLNQVCMGDSLTLTANPSGGNGGNVISWAVANGTGSAMISAAGVLQPTSAGTVNVSYAVTDNKTCSAISALFTVTIDTIPTPIIVANDTTICQGDMVEFTASGGTTYEFLVNNMSQQGPAVIDTFVSTTLNHNDSVRVVVTNAAGCFDTSSVIRMVVDTIPLATLVSDAPNNTKGIGQAVTFTASGGTTYEFFVNNTSQGAASATTTFTTSTLSHLDTVMVNVTDGNTCSDTATIVMNINDRPVAINDTIIILEDALFDTIDVQANDTDPEGDLLTTVIVVGAVHGVNATINDSTIQYMPNANFNGLDSITYWVCDAFSNCAAAKVYITVQSVNDIPMANSDTLRITEDDPTSLIEVLANDTDADGDSLNVEILTVPSKGMATVIPDSTIAYTPMPDSSGIDVIAYKVCDTKDSCSVGIVFIEITPVNDRPEAVRDSITIQEDSMNVRIPILANDLDADRDVITIDTVYPPTSGGTIVVSNDTVLYNPPANFNGLDSIKYAICDTALCDTTYVIINVLPVNEAPIAVNDTTTIPEDTTTIKIAFLANDMELDGETISLDSLFIASLGTTAVVNDTLCYTPLANANGIDTLKYIITDGTFRDSAYIFVNILSINDAPIAGNDTVTIPENSIQQAILVQLNDSDPDGDLFSTELVDGPTNGTAFAGGGSILYTPPTSFNGLDTITYRICDAQVPQACDTATIFIMVSGVNDPPLARNDTICIGEDTTAVAIAIELNDFDLDGDATSISILTGANHALIDSIRNDSLIYQPAANFNGIDSIRYQLFDGSLADQAWVYITIKPRNDAPVTMADSLTILEDALNVQIAVTVNDSDVDLGDSLKVNVVAAPTSGGTATILNDTIIVYNPAANFFGLDTIIYQVCDTSNACTIDTVFVTIQSVNEPPTAVDDALTIDEDASSVIIDVQANDSDGDGDTFTTTIISTPMMADTLNGDSIMVTAPTDFTGVQVIVYKICDPSGLCDTANVTITILPINDAPVANTDTVAIPQDTTNVAITPLINDTDVDDVTLTITTVSSPTTANGVATIIGTDSINYTPLAGFNGIDTIHYTVCDTSNLCDNGIIVINIGFVNTPPNAVNDNLPGIAEDSGPVGINVLLNDADIDGLADSLKVTNITTPVNGGTATIAGDSTISYTPALNFNGIDSLQYTVCDTSMGCATAWVFFTVTPVNDAPIAVNDTTFLSKDTTGAQIVVLTNDNDIDGDALTVSTIGTSTQGVTATVSGNLIVYAAPTGFLGVDTITYKITDTGGLMDTALLIVVITDPNNVPPIANPDFATTVPTVAVNIDVQDNDFEPNGDNLITTIIGGPNAGNTATVLNQDSIQYTSAITFAGYDTIWYQVCDPSLTCDTSMVIITVENTLAISARVILEGAYDRTSLLMHDSLRKLNFLPVIEPYSTWPRLAGAYEFAHKNGGGNEIITNPGTVLGVTGPNAIVDWVYLELLTAADTIPIASRSALIQRDGDIVDVDGVSPVAFEKLPNGNYFLSIRHRNHLGVMTKTALPFAQSAFTTLDFTIQGTGGTTAFGTNAMDTVQSRLVLWAGDGNADRKIIYDGIANDRDPVFFDVITDPLNINSNYNHVSFGYYRGDYDMKGSSVYLGSGNDPDVIFFNVFLHPNNAAGSTIFIISEQIPR